MSLSRVLDTIKQNSPKLVKDVEATLDKVNNLTNTVTQIKKAIFITSGFIIAILLIILIIYIVRGMSR